MPRPKDGLTRTGPPSRQGKKAVTAYFEPEVVRQLKRLGIEADKSMQAMMSEAVEDYLKRHGKPAQATPAVVKKAER